ncbi:hypothetical protein J6590_032467 [Homalodisca vitripennis]|nr:hypothetical protein J6590_032467 [Homalodisca vitripennis]
MFLYKLVRGVVDDPASLAVLSYRVPSFNSRSNLLFSVPFCRTTAHASSPLYRQVRENSLPVSDRCANRADVIIRITVHPALVR